ncbi:MAG: hypothetical protein JKX76_00415, partial [Colwellia sp.]|nr:hypothetical protein [Colwellia sp.]
MSNAKNPRIYANCGLIYAEPTDPEFGCRSGALVFDKGRFGANAIIQLPRLVVEALRHPI